MRELSLWARQPPHPRPRRAVARLPVLDLGRVLQSQPDLVQALEQRLALQTVDRERNGDTGRWHDPLRCEVDRELARPRLRRELPDGLERQLDGEHPVAEAVGVEDVAE